MFGGLDLNKDQSQTSSGSSFGFMNQGPTEDLVVSGGSSFSFMQHEPEPPSTGFSFMSELEKPGVESNTPADLSSSFPFLSADHVVKSDVPHDSELATLLSLSPPLVSDTHSSVLENNLADLKLNRTSVKTVHYRASWCFEKMYP